MKMAVIQLGNKLIDSSGEEVFVIAEIGQNHQGRIDIAKNMILEAKRAGCDCVKFQKSNLDHKFTKAALNRTYNGVHSWGQTYGEHKQHLEFTVEEYYELQNFCKEVGIEFTASAMDEMSLVVLDAMNVPFIKIGSGDANNFPMLEKSAKLNRPLVISTGMQTMATINKIVDIMRSANKTNYALLHCVSSYPTDPKDCTLQMISLLKSCFPDVVVGYSGHEIGIQISKAAVLLGARIVERHFTLDKEQKGSDHKCSLDANELQQMIKDIKLIKMQNLLKIPTHTKEDILDLCNARSEIVEAALSQVSDKVILPCEYNCKRKLGKSIVAAQDMVAGHKLHKDDILIKVSEPNGIPAENYDKVLGAELVVDVKQDFPIMYTDLLALCDDGSLYSTLV